MKAQDDYSLEHGVGATLIALAIPETWLSLAERLAFAVTVAVVSTTLSKAASWVWHKVFDKKTEEKE